MSEKKHSWWSPSNSARSIRCPASIKAAEKLPCIENSNNTHAELGTECHEAMEMSVMIGEPMWDDHPFTDPKNQKELCEIAWDALQSFLNTNKPDIVKPETQVDLKEYGYEDIFGTADLLAYNKKSKTVYVMDFKFGYNEVKVEMNEQLMTYALGALKEFPEATDVTLVIIQPKVSKDCLTWSLEAIELERWFTDTLEPAIQEALSENPKFNPGEEQCKFCPVAKHGCKYQTQQYLTAIEEFKPAEAYELADDKLTRLLVMIPAMQDAIKAVEVAAIERMKKGRKLDGYKLVRGQTKRKFKDVDATDQWLRSKRFKLDDISDRKLKSPAQVEKLVAKKRFSAAVVQEFRDMIDKPEGKITYAPVTDKRAAIEINMTAAITESILDDIL